MMRDAAIGGNVNIMKFLCEQEMMDNITDTLIFAVESKQMDIVQYLCENYKSINYDVLILITAEQCDLEIFNYLMMRRNIVNR